MVKVGETRSIQLAQRGDVTTFLRGRTVTHFTSRRFGLVITPSEAVVNVRKAEKLVKYLAVAKLEKGRIYEFEPGLQILLKAIGDEGRSLIFQPAPLPTDDFVLPEHLKSSVLGGKGGPPREYFLDSVKVSPATARLVSEIEIEDPKAAAFVQAKLGTESGSARSQYLLVYHNYRDVDTDKISLKADALVMVHKGKDGATYILVHKWKSSILTKLTLETVVEEHPAHVVISSDQIKHPPKLYGDIYQKSERKKLPLDELQDVWPFPLPKAESIVDLRPPSSTIKEKLALYREAIRRDNIFGLSAVGSLFHSTGKGLAEGALLYPILNLAQDELKVAALLGFGIKAGLAFYLVANNRAAAEVSHIEAKERLGEALDKQFPLWDMGAQSKTTDTLMRRYTKITLAYLAAQAIYFQLFPPIFKTVSGAMSPLTATSLFVGGYLAAEFINVTTDAFDLRNSFKFAENRLRYNPKLPEYEKKFWFISAFHDNLGLTLNQFSFWLGFGAFSLVSIFMPAYAAAAGITLGALSLALSCGRFLLPLFGRGAETRLEIKETDFLRYGRSLKISDNIILKLGDNPKVEIIEQPNKNRLVIPDFDKSGVKLRITNLDSITVKRSWLSRIFPFKFARKYLIVIKTKDSSDPQLILTIFGREPFSAAEVRKRFIEER